jgi:hypothetical protein
VQEELRSYLAIGMQSRALTGAMALGKELQTAATLESKISGFSAFEQAQLGAEARLPALEKLIRERYDALYSRDNFKTDEQKYVLFDGSRSDTNPYIEELETCRRLSEVMLAWPGNVSSEVTVCLPQLNSAGEDCQTSSILMLRWQFAGCVCRARAPRVDQKCTGLVGQLIAETCPGEMTRDCYARVARLTAEQMSIDIRLPALATAAAAPGTPR